MELNLIVTIHLALVAIVWKKARWRKKVIFLIQKAKVADATRERGGKSPRNYMARGRMDRSTFNLNRQVHLAQALHRRLGKS